MINLLLGIAASVLTIISLFWNYSNANKIKNYSKTITAGDDSVNTNGDQNTVNYDKR